MSATTTIVPASEAKAKFSEFLERTQSGESFVITLYGEEVAKLVPTCRKSLEEIQAVIAAMKADRFVLNPPGHPKVTVKELRDQGRP